LFAVIRHYYPRWLLYATLTGVMLGNTIEAAADLGGMAAALNLLIPLPIPWIVASTAGLLVVLQLWGSYTLIRNIFRWLALALLAYIPAALLAKPDVWAVLKGTLLPRLQFTQDSLSLLVAVIGTTLSAYLYTWQSNEEVEEEIAMGRLRLSQRRGATDTELRKSWWDIVVGMAFSNVIMYFILLATASTLFPAGQTDINTAAEAAHALQPLAGKAAGLLFALGVVGVGFLAVPVMISGAAYDMCQTFGWKHSLHARPREAKAFYAVIILVSLVAVGLNFLGINPMKALVWSGIVQGFSTPPLLLLIMLMTNNRRIMGEQVNSRALNVLGWITTGAIFAATVGLVISWLL
jgi:Mn2+/Fe2+ NRAMP family transporter